MKNRVVEIKESEPRPLRLKPEGLLHFGEGDELSLCEDVGFSERDKPLDLEWTPSLRDKLMKEAHSLEYSLTHFPTAKCVVELK